MTDVSKSELVTAQLERILASPPLESSPSLCRFLRYVVEETLAGRSGSLKEYSLGVVAFDRGEDFDPRMDPIVRVQARNLRVRLGRYYEGPGAGDPIVIELPKRTYVPVFRSRIEELPIAEALLPAPTERAIVVSEPRRAAAQAFIVTTGVVSPEIASPTVRSWRRSASVTGATLFLLLAGAAVLWQSHPYQEAAVLASHDPEPAAQDLYIRGRYLMDRPNERALLESIECFRQAIGRAPQFASAYAGLADAYNRLAQHGYIAPSEGMEEGRRAAERALQIDPNLAEAHVALAAIIEAYDWKWSAAEREYKRALSLNPSLPAAHLWYGMFLRDQGRLKEALPELRRAAQLEPFSILTSLNLANAFYMTGDYGAALEQARHAAEMAPGLVSAEVILAHIYVAQSQTAQADAALARALGFSQDDPHALAVLARAYVHQGKRDQGARLFHRLEELATQRYVSPFDLGSVSLMLGDEKHAVDLLEEAFRQRSSGMIYLRDAKLPNGHNSPQFDQLIEKMHFAG